MASQRTDSHRWPPLRIALPVWFLLTLLALVPSLGMATFAASAAAAKARTVSVASEVQRRTVELTELMNLIFALSREQVPSQALAEAHRYGFTPAQANGLIGFDLSGRRSQARANTDAALAGLPDRLFPQHEELRDLGDQMARVRQVVETPDAPPGRIEDAFSAVISTTRKAAEAELIQLSGLVSELGAAPVDSALAAFASSIDVSQWVMGEAKALADVVFSGGQASVIRLAIEADGHKREVDDLLSHADPTVRATWDRLNTAPNARRFDEAVQTEISNPGAIRARGLQGVGEVFADSLAQWNMFAELVPVAGHSGVVAAHQAQVAASAAQRRAVATWAGVGVLTLGLTVLVSWAISRPLGRLAEGAMRVSEGGGLARVSFSPRGPREVQVVARALDEAVASLRRVEAQARALATGELDDEALRTTEPGALGDAVQASVEQLSRSLREQEQLRRRLAHQASHDALTGLPNRVGALAAADQALARARRTGQQIALLFIDLDGFKRANDDHGHGIGDLVLRATAERLKEVVRVGDAVARWEATSSW